jgi:hypothetical protein
MGKRALIVRYGFLKYLHAVVVLSRARRGIGRDHHKKSPLGAAPRGAREHAWRLNDAFEVTAQIAAATVYPPYPLSPFANLFVR